MRNKLSILAFVSNVVGLIIMLSGIFLTKEQSLINLGIAITALSCSYLLMAPRKPGY